MKKTLAILTLVVMLAALIVPVAMAMVEATAACDHPGVYAAENYSGYTNNGSSGHTFEAGFRYRCTSCNAVMGKKVETSTTSAHTLTYIDKNHGTGTTHHYAKDCTKCSYYVNSTYTCPGGTSCYWPF